MSWGEQINNFTVWVKMHCTAKTHSCLYLRVTLTFGHLDMIITCDKLKGSRAYSDADALRFTRPWHVVFQKQHYAVWQLQALYDNTLSGVFSGKNTSINGTSWDIFPEVD